MRARFDCSEPFAREIVAAPARKRPDSGKKRASGKRPRADADADDAAPDADGAADAKRPRAGEAVDAAAA